MALWLKPVLWIGGVSVVSLHMLLSPRLYIGFELERERRMYSDKGILKYLEHQFFKAKSPSLDLVHDLCHLEVFATALRWFPRSCRMSWLSTDQPTAR